VDLECVWERSLKEKKLVKCNQVGFDLIRSKRC